MKFERLDQVIRHERHDHGIDVLAPWGVLLGMGAVVLALYSALVL